MCPVSDRAEMRFYAPAQIHEGLETEFFNLLLAEPVSNSLSFHERLHLWRGRYVSA